MDLIPEQMKNAPKNTWILAYSRFDKRWLIVKSTADATYAWQDDWQRYRFDVFTAWMPMPAAPEGK